MGERQQNLEKIFKRLGKSVNSTSVPFPTFNLAKASIFSDELLSIYEQLGGVKKDFPINLRKWDMEVDGVAVELDEFLHFNRYRALTLQSQVYQSLPLFPLSEYKKYCQTYESRCLKAGSYGGKWSNSSCESQFGPAAKAGVLDSNGSPRWKQRAFYDLVKDLTPLLLGKPVVRIAIWDSVELNGRSMLVNDILMNPNTSTDHSIYALFKTRGQL